METYTEPKELVENPQYSVYRQKSLDSLTDDKIDAPIVEIIHGFNRLPYCFTMQCCYGHFVYDGQNEKHNLEPLPDTAIEGEIEYRIAYIAFCIENSDSGRKFIEVLKSVPAVDPDNIQFCSAEWFWKRHINTYALQVEPDRFKRQDTAKLGYEEAIHIEKVRERFFTRLRELLITL
ncbi:hypothetical protein ACFL7D_11610 [candidate division KSB1 bacterium]